MKNGIFHIIEGAKTINKIGAIKELKKIKYKQFIVLFSYLLWIFKYT